MMGEARTEPLVAFWGIIRRFHRTVRIAPRGREMWGCSAVCSAAAAAWKEYGNYSRRGRSRTWRRIYIQQAEELKRSRLRFGVPNHSAALSPTFAADRTPQPCLDVHTTRPKEFPAAPNGLNWGTYLRLAGTTWLHPEALK